MLYILCRFYVRCIDFVPFYVFPIGFDTVPTEWYFVVFFNKACYSYIQSSPVKVLAVKE